MIVGGQKVEQRFTRRKEIVELRRTSVVFCAFCAAANSALAAPSRYIVEMIEHRIDQRERALQRNPGGEDPLVIGLRELRTWVGFYDKSLQVRVLPNVRRTEETGRNAGTGMSCTVPRGTSLGPSIPSSDEAVGPAFC